MTPEEHQLIVYMLQEQQVAIAALIEGLKERGAIQASDVEAFTQILATSGAKNLVERNVEDRYRVAARAFGVMIGEFPQDVP